MEDLVLVGDSSRDFAVFSKGREFFVVLDNRLIISGPVDFDMATYLMNQLNKKLEETADSAQ